MLGTLALWATLIQPAVTPCSANRDAVDRVRAVASGIIDADNAADIDRVMGFYDLQAWLMPPNEPPVQGHERIRPRYESWFRDYRPAIEGSIDEVCVTGPTAYVRGRNGGRLVGKAALPSRDLDDLYLMLPRSDHGGQWRITHLTWHAGRR